MAEPLRLDVELGAQGVAAGIGEISKASDGLKVSSQKASFAVKAFANDIANAKDASDVASAALGAFTRILGTSVAATVFAAGAKAIYDAYSEITGAVDKAKKSLEEAYEVTSRGGLAENFAEGVAQAKEFEKVADSVNKKIKEINDSPLKNLLDAITGSTDKMRETVALAEQEAIRRREAASAAELQYQISIDGATDEQKAIKEVEKALADQLDQINVLKEGKTAENLIAVANLKKEAIERKSATEERQKSEKNLSEVIRERAQNELKAYEAEAKARQEAQKIFETFEAEKAKAHKEELERSAERIGTIQDEIKAIQERGDALRKSLISAGGDIAMLGAATFGSGRGAGQRMTSGEIGTIRAADRAAQEGRRQAGLQARAEAKQRIIEEAQKAKKKPDTSGYAIDRMLRTMAEEAAKQKAVSPVDEFKKLEEQLKQNNNLEEKKAKELENATKAQEELNKTTNETKATFDDVDYSVNRLGGTSDDASDALKATSSAAYSADSSLGTLAESASNLANIFSGINEFAVQTINTNTIDTDSILLS